MIDKSLSDRATVRSRTSDVSVHGIFDFLTEAAEQHGWRLIYFRAGNSAVQFHWGEGKHSYRHSFIVNVGDLLFYLRTPALKSHPLWSEVSARVFPEGAVTIDANDRNETTIRIATMHDAKLAEQLFLKPIM
jgi:hypothetical protein